jgi:hypothetical protein
MRPRFSVGERCRSRHFHRPYWLLGLTSAWGGNFQAAEDALKQRLELCPGTAFRSRLLGALTSYAPSFELAQIEIGLGNHAGALAFLEHAVVRRDSYAIFLKTWNTFAPLRQQPRFHALLSQIGLE